MQNMIMLTSARKLCQCSTWSSKALGKKRHSNVIPLPEGESHTPPIRGLCYPTTSCPTPYREWFSPRATAMRQMPWEVSMSPFCTACRSCSCSPSTSGMSFRSVFTYLGHKMRRPIRAVCPTPTAMRERHNLPIFHQILGK